jgi:hypothetical protein
MKAKIKATEGSGKAGKLPFELRGFVALAEVALSGAITSLLYLHVYIILLWNLCARSENVTGKMYPCLSVVRVYPCLSVVRVYPCLSVVRVYPCLSIVRVYPCLSIVPRVHPSVYNTAYPFFVTKAELLHIRDTV